MIIGKCLACDSPLKHLIYPVTKRCADCGKEENTYIICQNGHYLCNSCAAKKSIEKVKKNYLIIDKKHPIDVAEILFEECGIFGNSPHVISAIAFLIAYKNAFNSISDEQLLDGIRRAEKIPGGWCGYYGACGAGIGIGVAFSVITGATPMSDTERSIANIASSRCLEGIAEHGGPRCCSASVRVAIEKGIEVAREYLNVEFPEQEEMYACWQKKNNAYCRKNKCKFFLRKDNGR